MLNDVEGITICLACPQFEVKSASKTEYQIHEINQDARSCNFDESDHRIDVKVTTSIQSMDRRTCSPVVKPNKTKLTYSVEGVLLCSHCAVQ